ncbi:DDE_3 domain-containing protein [Trichonephila clavipes]|nr:DDE_3 domain-containing protein [Trichonephila clavipes]
MWVYSAGSLRETWNRPECHSSPGIGNDSKIMVPHRTDLHVQIGIMTSQIYRDVSLEQHERLLMGTMGAKFVFINDNARLHRANIVYKCLQSEDIVIMDWHALSLDLNPAQNVWDILG